MTETILINKKEKCNRKFQVEINLTYHLFNGRRYTDDELHRLARILRNVETDDGREFGFLHNIADIIENK